MIFNALQDPHIKFIAFDSPPPCQTSQILLFFITHCVHLSWRKFVAIHCCETCFLSEMAGDVFLALQNSTLVILQIESIKKLGIDKFTNIQI